MIITAPAKINWSLDIVGKRQEDGYHLLQTVMQQISLSDEIILEKADADILTCDVDLPNDENNIALRAWLLLKEELGLSECLSIDIKKHIPVAAGLGGGSTDAAAVLKGANQLFSLGLSHKHLAKIALQIGSDVPFCLLGGAVLAEGIGEILTPLPSLEKQTLLLVNPGLPVSTADVYQKFSLSEVKKRPHTQLLIDALLLGQVTDIGPLLINVLESVTTKTSPQINKIKFEMAACGLYPLMSGSGASVFGLAPDQKTAEMAQQKLAKNWSFAEVCSTL